MFKNEYKPHESWVDSFNLDTEEYLKNEISYFVHIQPLYDKHDIKIKDTFKEFRFGRLYEPFYFFSFIQGEVGIDTPFDDPVFIGYLGIIYKNRNFPKLIERMYIKDILYESESEELVSIQKAKLEDGGMPLIKTTHRALPYPLEMRNFVDYRILQGETHEDLTRRIYMYNTTNDFATVEKTYWHDDRNGRYTRLKTQEIQPWRDEVHLSFGSDSIQYEPNIGQKSNIAYYSTLFRAHVDLDYTEVVDVYGIKAYNYKAKGRFYQLSNRDDNPYRNYLYENTFNATEIMGSSVFVSYPYYSNFGSRMKSNACIMNDMSNKKMNFNHKDDTSIKIEFYSGMVLKSKKSYQLNYAFDTYPKAFDSFIYFVPSYIYTERLEMSESFAKEYFDTIKSKEQARKFVLIICFAVGGVLFSLGISTCIIIFIKSSKQEEDDTTNSKSSKKSKEFDRNKTSLND